MKKITIQIKITILDDDFSSESCFKKCMDACLVSKVPCRYLRVDMKINIGNL